MAISFKGAHCPQDELAIRTPKPKLLYIERPALLPSGAGSVENGGQERACGLVVEADAHERHRLDHA